jgi:hypothetical protein
MLSDCQHTNVAEWVRGCGGAAHGFSLIDQLKLTTLHTSFPQ